MLIHSLEINTWGKRKKLEGLMLKSNRLRKLFYAVMCALILAVMLPVTALGQRRWVVVRPHRGRVVVYNYQPRPYVVYQPRPYYTYRTYSNGYQPYYSYGYEPYYTNYTNQYSYRYSQPYFVNGYTYSWANPTYRYNDYRYYHRHRHNRVRVGVSWR